MFSGPDSASPAIADRAGERAVPDRSDRAVKGNCPPAGISRKEPPGPNDEDGTNGDDAADDMVEDVAADIAGDIEAPEEEAAP
ncbi:MAG TPA: hypothetical protein DD982_09905 [Thalassospira sp.]|nr:hypothetical protein [Thalassospira sp.]HBS22821.1 hypothetical protein [Thalassospira sp.]